MNNVICFVLYFWLSGFVLSSLATTWAMGKHAVTHSLVWPSFWWHILNELEEPGPGETNIGVVLLLILLIVATVLLTLLLVHFFPFALLT